MFSKIVELEKCSFNDKGFNPNTHEKHSLLIDYNKSMVQQIIILTDNHFKKTEKEIIK